MAKRYIGDAVITIEYVGTSSDNRETYRGTVRAGGKTWKFDDLNSGVGGFRTASDSPEAYDEMARSAASFGSYYSSNNRGEDTPDWAPDPETADAIDEAVSWAQDDRGEYEVRRSAKGPAREETYPHEGRVADLPKYRPSKSRRYLKVARVVPSGGGAWRVEFEEGFSIQVHSGSGTNDRLYAMKPIDMRYEGRSPGPETRRDYQYLALEAVLAGRAADFVVDRDGDVMAYLKEGQAISEQRAVQDYIAVDRNDRRIAGPFRTRGEAEGHVPPGGYIKFSSATRRRAPPPPSSYPMFREEGDQYGVEPVPLEARAKALEFAIARYRHHRELGVSPEKAYHKTWAELQRAAYGVRSQFGYFIRYAHQIGEIVHEAQQKVDAELAQRPSRGRQGRRG